MASCFESSSITTPSSTITANSPSTPSLTKLDSFAIILLSLNYSPTSPLHPSSHHASTHLLILRCVLHVECHSCLLHHHSTPDHTVSTLALRTSRQSSSTDYKPPPSDGMEREKDPVGSWDAFCNGPPENIPMACPLVHDLCTKGRCNWRLAWDSSRSVRLCPYHTQKMNIKRRCQCCQSAARSATAAQQWPFPR